LVIAPERLISTGCRTETIVTTMAAAAAIIAEPGNSQRLTNEIERWRSARAAWRSSASSARAILAFTISGAGGVRAPCNQVELCVHLDMVAARRAPNM
jgi:hypothetical protein